MQASFSNAERLDRRSVSALRDRHGAAMEPLIRRLIYMSVSPPAAANYDAQIMVGNLASYAFELMKDRLERAVRYSPLAFRVWRAITRMVEIRGDSEDARDLMVWVRQLVRNCGAMRAQSRAIRLRKPKVAGPRERRVRRPCACPSWTWAESDKHGCGYGSPPPGPVRSTRTASAYLDWQLLTAYLLSTGL